MYKYILLLLFVASSGCVSAAPEHIGLGPADYYRLSSKQVAEMEQAGLAGNGKAAWDLAHYYTFTKEDKDQSRRWYKVSAENGYAPGMYAYAFTLKQTRDPNVRNEARSWFERAKRSDNARASELAGIELRDMDKDGQANP